MALILTTRPIDGPIHIINEDTGQEMTIDLIGVQGSQARLSFEAGQNITILRDKPYQEQGNES